MSTPNGSDRLAAAPDDAARRPQRSRQTPWVGPVLRARRIELGISQRQLAHRLGISPTLVSQIERDRTQPSLRTLQAIVTQLALSYDELFGTVGRGPDAAGAMPVANGIDALPPAPAAVPRGGPVVHSEAGVRWERVPGWGDGRAEFLIATYAPGAVTTADLRPGSARGRDLVLVLGGALHAYVRDEELLLRSGQAINFRSWARYRFENRGPGEARALWATDGSCPPD